MPAIKIPSRSVLTPAQAVLDPILQQGERCTLLVIQALADPDTGFAAVTAKSLEPLIGVSHWTIRRHIRVLEHHKFVERGHQFEHQKMLGGCPWVDCLGVFVALTPTGGRHKWARAAEVGTKNWKAAVGARMPTA